jgi:FtsH-binding integral membrane protein
LADSAYARNVLRFAWHLTTLAWWGVGAILVVLALSPFQGRESSILLIVTSTFLVTGLVALVMSRGRHLAGPVFLVIAGLSALSLLSSTTMH